MRRIIIGNKPYSSHPGDHYLKIVLCQLPDNALTPYVTWIFNTDFSGYSEGHYHVTLKEALADFNSRGAE